MADAEDAMTEVEEESSDTSTLRYLGRVLDVLLDPSKKIVDDTSLQRLLEYCKIIFSHKDICKQEDGLKHVFDFLEACCVKEPQDFDPSALTFALQLVRCLSSNQELLNRLMIAYDVQTNSEEAGAGEGLLVRLLKRASNEDFFSDPCMKEAWLIALHTLSSIESFWRICIQTDALRIAVDLLQDTSMFVVKSTQRFLARMLTIQYRQDSQKTSQSLAQEPKKSKPSDGQDASSSQETLQECPQDERSKMADHEDLVQVEQDASSSQETLQEGHQDGRRKIADHEHLAQDEQDMLINGEDAGGDGGEALKRKVDEVDVDKELLSSVQKKSRQSASCDVDAERSVDLEVLQICERLMESEEAASILASLLLDLQTSDNHKQTVLQVSQPSGSEMKTVHSLGVFRCILNDASEGENQSRGLHLLRDVSMATRCREILCKDGQLSDKLCEDVVEFLGCLLQLESKMCTSWKPSLILGIQSLPYELTKKGLVKSAIHLSFSIVKLCSILSQRSELDAASVMKVSLSVILGPVCVIMERSPLKTDLTLDQGVVQELREKMIDGRRASSIICTTLSALGDIVKEDCSPSSLPTCQVFHLAVVLLHACTPNAKKTSQSKGLIDDCKALIGSRKIMTSLLDLLHVSLSGTCVSADIWMLVDLINTNLKNPDAEYQTILKVLTIVPDLIPIAMGTEEHPVSIENTKRDALLMEVGYALQKRMCNIEWEVRDSTIACVGKLLQNKSDTVKQWLKRNNLHMRLWESLEDSESYVRSTTLQTLPVLVSCKELWDDVLSGSHITLVEVVAKVTEVIKSDSEAFPRRAAIGCLLTWLQHEQWMQDCINIVITKGNSEKSSPPPSSSSAAAASSSSSAAAAAAAAASSSSSSSSSAAASSSSSSAAAASSSSSSSSAAAASSSSSAAAAASSSSSSSSSLLQGSAVSKVQDGLAVSLQGLGATDGASASECMSQETDPTSKEQMNPREVKVGDEGCVVEGEIVSDAVSGATDGCSQATRSVQNRDSGSQEQKNPESKVRDECMILGDIVLDAVSIAMCDFDWEMKLHALEFYLLLSKQYLPGYANSSASSSVKSIDSMRRRKLEELCEEVEMKVVVRFFSRTGCLAKLVQGSRDEDVSVARKACEMLHSLEVALGDLFKKSESALQTRQEDGTDNSVAGNENDQCSVNEQTTPTTFQNQDTSGTETPAMGTQDTLKDGDDSELGRKSVYDLIGQLFEIDWIGLLQHREADNVEGPVSLMMDILAAVDEKEENLLDCY